MCSRTDDVFRPDHRSNQFILIFSDDQNYRIIHRRLSEFDLNAIRRFPGYLFDPALQRFMSARASSYEYFKPTGANSLKAFALSVLPVAILTYVVYKDRTAFWEKCKTGQIPYEKRMFTTF